MNADEAHDLNEMRKKVQEEKIKCFDYLIYLSRLKEDELKQSGFKSTEQAIMTGLKDHNNRIIQIVKEHTKKYPD